MIGASLNVPSDRPFLKRRGWPADSRWRAFFLLASHAFVRCDLPHLDLRRSGPQCTGAKRRKTMKTSKQIPLWLTIDVLIIVVGLGLIALGIFTAATRIFGTPV